MSLFGRDSFVEALRCLQCGCYISGEVREVGCESNREAYCVQICKGPGETWNDAAADPRVRQFLKAGCSRDETQCLV